MAELWGVEWGSTWGVGGKVRVSILGTGSSMRKGMKPQSTEARLENWGLLVIGNGSNELSKQEAKQRGRSETPGKDSGLSRQGESLPISWQGNELQ